MGLSKSQRSLRSWTKQDWGTKSGKKSSETGERYLPKAARDSLTSAEYAATTAKKRKDTAAGKQHSKQPKRIAKKTRGARQFKQIGGPVKRQNLDNLFHNTEFNSPTHKDYIRAKAETARTGKKDGPEVTRYMEKERLYRKNYEEHLQNMYKILKDKHNINVKEVDFEEKRKKYKEYENIPKKEAILQILKDSEIPLGDRTEAAMMQVLEELPREHIMPTPLIENKLANTVYNILESLSAVNPVTNQMGFKVIKNVGSLLNYIRPNKELTIALDANMYPEHREKILVEELKHVHQLRGLKSLKTNIQSSIEQLKDSFSDENEFYYRYDDPKTIEGIHRRKEEFEPELKKYGYGSEDDDYDENEYFNPDTYN